MCPAAPPTDPSRFATGAATAIGYGIYAIVAAGGPNSKHTATSKAGAAPAHRYPPGDLGTVAFLRRGSLDVLDLNGCTTRALVHSNAAGDEPLAVTIIGGVITSIVATIIVSLILR